MADKKPRKIRYSDSELSLIKNTFADNQEEKLTLYRKLFLQVDLNTSEILALNAIRSNKELISVIKKTFLPTIDVNAPNHQIVDLWLTTDIKDKPVEVAHFNLVAREALIEYLSKQIDFIEHGKENTIKFNSLSKVWKTNAKKTVVNFTVRNTVVNHIEMMMSQLFVLAGYAEETVEQTKERLAKNSAQ